MSASRGWFHCELLNEANLDELLVGGALYQQQLHRPHYTKWASTENAEADVEE